MEASNSISAEVIKILVQVVSIALGWFVVHKLSIERDRDKARRELLVKAADGLSDDVTKLLTVANGYHTNARDISIEDNIKMTLQDISTRANLLSEISPNHEELASCRSAILAFKQSITATHFEDEHNVALEHGSAQMQSIAHDCLAVRQCFLKLKHKQFPVA